MENSRRSFIKKSALGVAGITIGGMSMNANSYNRIIGANDRLNVAIVGLGRRLGAFPEPIARKESNVQLLYLCDVMKSQREKAAQRFAGIIDYTPSLENDVRKIQDDNRVDAMILATPDHWHAPGTCYAVQAGKHVYVEKPCSHNPREGELLVELQKKYGKVIQMGNQQRSSLTSTEIVNEIHNGSIGVPYKAIAFYSNARGESPVPVKAPVPEGLDWDLFQGPAPRQEYKHDTWDYNWHWYGWTWGTAETGNNAVHELDIARWALQVDFPERVEVAAGKFHYPDDGWTMYDTMDATWSFPGNKIIKWDGKSRNAYKTYGADRGTIIFGSEGSVFMNRGGYKLYDRGGNLVRERGTGDYEGGTALGGGGNMSTMHVVNFFNSIRGKDVQKSPIDEGVKSTHLGHLANIAYRIGKGFDVNCVTGQALDRDALKLWSREYEPGWKPEI
ncbi:MAG: Gfo/Idh/MocA family oxidoreductase [Bacteroidales bacterium]